MYVGQDPMELASQIVATLTASTTRGMYENCMVYVQVWVCVWYVSGDVSVGVWGQYRIHAYYLMLW